MFHKVVWQHMQGVVGCLIRTLLQIYQRILQWKKLWKSVKIWQNCGHEFVASLFWPTLYMWRINCLCLTCSSHFSSVQGEEADYQRTLTMVRGWATSAPPCSRNPHGSFVSRRTTCALSTSTSPIIHSRARHGTVMSRNRLFTPYDQLVVHCNLVDTRDWLLLSPSNASLTTTVNRILPSIEDRSQTDPRYHEHYRELYLAKPNLDLYDLDFQSPEICWHDPYTCKKLRSKVRRFKW